MDRNYFVISLPNLTTEHFDFLFANNIVAIGYREICQTIFFYGSKELVVSDKITEVFNSTTDEDVKNKILEFETFLNIKDGDYVLIPYFNNICFAIATDERMYDLNENLGFHNQITVNYLKNGIDLKTKPLINISSNLQNRITEMEFAICKLDEFSDEINNLIMN